MNFHPNLWALVSLVCVCVSQMNRAEGGGMKINENRK